MRYPRVIGKPFFREAEYTLTLFLPGQRRLQAADEGHYCGFHLNQIFAIEGAIHSRSDEWRRRDAAMIESQTLGLNLQQTFAIRQTQ
jgi:hypothetical protein